MCKFVTVKKDSQLGIPKNMWIIPYLLHAYDVKRSNFQNKRKNDKQGISKLTEGYKKRAQWNKGECAINHEEPRSSEKEIQSTLFLLTDESLESIQCP
jgi:hypothetical protein